MTKQPRKKLARLNANEDATYNGAFEYYFNNVRGSNDRADKFAWRMCLRNFPRLRKYDGALPGRRTP